MTEKWLINGKEYVNCNCDYGCPCQFNAPSTHGKCEALGAIVIDEGHYGDTKLDGLCFVMAFKWPSEIKDGNGQGQIFITEKADENQREAIRKIASGEASEPGTSHFYIFNSTLSKMHDLVVMPMEIRIDVEARKAEVRIQDVLKSSGNPLINPFTGEQVKKGIHLPDGFEYVYAHMGSGTTSFKSAFELEFKDSYGQFSVLYMNEAGVIRDQAVPL